VSRYTEEDVDFRGRRPDFEQLFDLSEDPGERENLIATHEGSDILAALRRLCQARSEELNDRREAYRQRFEPVSRVRQKRSE
jgi:hypothetical protein